MIMEIVYYVVLILYSLILLYILLFNLLQLELLLTYRRNKRRDTLQNGKTYDSIEKYPVVTIQLPVFNEKYVVSRLIDNICRLDYPIDKLEIQVLDDSTDETVTISQQKVHEYRAQGFDISLIQRKNRTGYKAGALQHGLQRAKGELIAIFDADFLPGPGFLREVVPSFQNPDVGVVQTRWEHLNQHHSLITEIQAFQLNVHFIIEQNARCQADYLLQFNGTAGIWRKSTILDAGGWHADTLTEDLDLSYRAQLHGWKILYRDDVGSPAELPAEISSYKSQQFRWMKGGAETARKLIPVIWNSDLPFWKKVHASAHLTASSIFLLIFAMAILSVPMIWAITGLHVHMEYYLIFAIGIISLVFIFFQANVSSNDHRSPGSRLQQIRKFVLMFPVFMAVSMGLSFHHSRAVLQGYRGKKSEFVRTPKVHSPGGDKNHSLYLTSQLSPDTWWEGFLSLYFVFGIAMGLYLHQYAMLILHVILATGFGLIFVYSIRANLSPGQKKILKPV